MRACHSKRLEAARGLEKGKKPTERKNLGTNQVSLIRRWAGSTKPFPKLRSMLAPSTSWLHSKRFPLRNLISSEVSFVF
jgi:hypothetical protein